MAERTDLLDIPEFLRNPQNLLREKDARIQELEAQLAQTAPHLRDLARLCEACEGSGEIMEDKDTARECQYCRPIWDLAQRIDPPKQKPAPIQEEPEDDIQF